MRVSTLASMGIGLLIASVFLSACASMPDQPGFDAVQEDVAGRIGSQLHWDTGDIEDGPVAGAIDHLIKEKLTADAAVQIALLNNRRIQSVYQNLGIAHTDLVQAGLLRNPVFSASLLFPVDGGVTEINLGVAQQFLDILLIPMRKQIAHSQFEETKLEVTGQVMDLAYRTRVLFFQTQAETRRIELARQRVFAAELAYDFAGRLYEAGNITALALFQERDFYERAKLKLRRAENAVHNRREQLNRLMGVWGEQTRWEGRDRLDRLSSDELELNLNPNDIERQAIETSLELAIARQQILTAGRRMGLNQNTALLTELEIGAEAEKNSDWAVGPSISVPLPIFDRGQPRLARSHADLRRAQEQFTALGVEIRSRAREALHAFEEARDIVRYYQEIMLPLHERISNETMLQYNAMQVGPLELLRAKDRQLEAGLEHIHATENYWIARTTIEQLLSGRIPARLD
jgi:outer membrane protein, heavy metal efflux system